MALFLIASVVTLVWVPERLTNFKAAPILWIVPILALLFIAGIRFFMAKNKPEFAFLSSALSILSMWGIVGASIFPNMVPALNNPAHSLTIMNSSSSELTLKTMLILAIIGVPIVLAYTFWVYKTFWGKVKLEGEGGYGGY